jgi:hypothetical protein
MKGAIAILLTLVSPPLVGAESAVIQQLRNDLIQKTFALRIDVAGNTCLYDQSISRPTSRHVDTEIDEEGGVQYYLRADRLNIHWCENSLGNPGDTLLTGLHIPPDLISTMHHPGEVVTVKQVDPKGDRIEIQLIASGSGDESYAKLKLMLGKGYDARTIEQIETALAHALTLPRIQGIESAKMQLSTIRNDIQHLEGDLRSQKADLRLAAATQLPRLYDDESNAFKAVNQIAFTTISQSQHTYSIAALKQIREAAAVQVQHGEVEAAAQAYSTSKSSMNSACHDLPNSPATTRAELNWQTNLVKSVTGKLAAFYAARAALLTLGQSVPDDDDAYYKQCSALSATLARTFAAAEQQVLKAEAAAAEVQRKKQAAAQLVALNVEYRQCQSERADLDTKLITVMGTSDEYSTFYQYRVLLQRMINNRQQAFSLGDKPAEGQIRTLTEQLQKLR